MRRIRAVLAGLTALVLVLACMAGSLPAKASSVDYVQGFPLPFKGAKYTVKVLAVHADGTPHESYLAREILPGGDHPEFWVADLGGAKIGSAVYAAAAGTVFRTGVDETLGNFVVLSHADGTYSCYGHLRYPCSLEVGSTAAAGSLVGRVGQTGEASEPLLHFEWSDHDPGCLFLNWGLCDTDNEGPAHEHGMAIAADVTGVTLPVGETYQLKYVTAPGHMKLTGAASSDRTVASVSAKGKIKAKEPGTVTITLQTGFYDAAEKKERYASTSVWVTVTAPLSGPVSLSPAGNSEVYVTVNEKQVGKKLTVRKNPAADQREFELEHVKGNIYRLVSVYSGRCLAAMQVAKLPWLQRFSFNTEYCATQRAKNSRYRNQRWEIRASGDSYTVKSVKTGLYLATSKGKTSNGTGVSLNSAETLWKLSGVSEAKTLTTANEDYKDLQLIVSTVTKTPEPAEAPRDLSDSYTGYVKGTDGALVINSIASSGNRIGAIPEGEACTVYPNEKSGNWVWVSFKGINGWVYGTYLTRTAPASPETDDDLTASYTGYVTGTAEGAVIYSAASGGDQAGIIPEGGACTVYPGKKSGDFVFVEYQGIRGWVLDQFLTETVPAGSALTQYPV